MSRPTWKTWRQARQVALLPEHLKKTVAIAAIIGSIFVSINQVPLLLSGHVDVIVIAKAVLTYLTPFCVSNYSILVATRASARTAA